METERQRLYRRQSLLVLAFSIAGAMLLLGALAILVFPYLGSPRALLWNYLYRVFVVLRSLADMQEALFVLLRSVGQAIPLAGWMLVLGGLSELVVFWIVSFRLLTKPRRVMQ